MSSPEIFRIALILIGYAAVELMLAQHGGTVLEMLAALLIAGVLVLYVYLRSRPATRAASNQAGAACSTCSTASCTSCASAPRSDVRP